MWFEESVIYQIYPLGLCGAPKENDGVFVNRLEKIEEYIPHIKKLGATAVLLNPLFESDRHGYDTRDFFKVDCRLGQNEDLKKLSQKVHESGLKLIFDGVFNHVGRGFWAFSDVQKNKWDSPYKDWFKISFDGNSPYNDGFWYEGWEGHFELVKLNLENPEVQNYIFDAIKNWISEYDIDGLRLDVAYSLPDWFLGMLRNFSNEQEKDFVLIGETLHGDYNRWANISACHSVTNYECYKGIYSSFNSGNMHEISFSLNRQFGYENWCIYQGKHLLSFVDNHDVSRISSIIDDKNQLNAVWGLLMSMPGVPSIYYGSEWGILGDKKDGDDALRPSVSPVWNETTDYVKALIDARNQSDALKFGGYRNLKVEPKQLIFERKTEKERVIVAINASSEEYTAHFDAGCGMAVDLITGKSHDFGGGSKMPPYSCQYWKCEK
ncbi:MAG: alpha-amylase family glycosyl hydrolase [Clostridia bacterium]|nr:alpha-amylase family glycosyl hydrolase [Clostridia bacterium]